MAYQSKSFNKFVATAATATLVAGAIAPVAFAASFTDVAPKYKEAVDFVASKGINGFSETQFGTDANIKRVDAAVMLAKVLELDIESAPASGFTDVPARAAKYINAIKAAGITSGKTATKFDADSQITRGELAIWIQKGFELKGEGELPFTDVNSRYAEAVKALVSNEITNGTSATQFGVSQSAKRGDFAIFLFRAANADTPEVVEISSVKAVNGKQIEVKFNGAVKKSSVIQSGNPDTLVNGVFTINELTTDNVVANAVDSADSLSASLSADGKTLTITADTFFDGRYEVVAKADAIEAADGKKLAGFTGVVTVNDTVKPSVTGVTYPNAKTARVNFSEPLSAEGLITAKYADGTTAAVTPVFTAGKAYIDLNVSALTANKEATVTIVGAKDAKGNIATPNPISVTVKKDTSDVTAPAVQSVTPTSATSFDLKLSEAVSKAAAADLAAGVSLGAIKVGTTDVTANAAVDSEDPTVIHVTGLSALTGLRTISVEANALVDFSGNLNAAFSQVVSFDADQAEPTIESTSVETINNVKYLVVNFNENVTPVAAKALVFNYVRDNGERASTTITTNAVAGTQGEATLHNAVNGVSKSIKINLGSLASEDYTVNLVAGLAEDGFGNDSVARNDVAVTVGAATIQQAVKLTTSTPASDVNNGVETVDSNTLRVHFTKELDIASATTAGNYAVEGATVEKAEIYKNNSTDGYIVELTLADNTVELAGEYDVKVSNVAAKNGTAMNTYTTTEVLSENVRPVVTKAVLATPQTVTLTFSEAVKNLAADADDFELLIGGVKVAANDVVSSPLQGTAATTLTVTLEAPVISADLAKGLSLKGLDTIDLVDAAGNKVSVAGTVAVQ
ncbi:hypothetical protein CVD28_09030 [Bacillus sp. M6-12]|uniref:S-layer homology domain-containing protein n=1 Tax=Bacillus sp. M6-12 TaxID=2054166 RepID=UPI000C756FD9|nr:S-layer homology domain-containing protein [Bacillus sp. M6-12]PLS17833.1 hypothetical protein CVD28_09030 [Bacillus sp. M6-12]